MSHSGDLFADGEAATPWVESLAPGASLLHGFALSNADELLAAIHHISVEAPFRHMVTPGGRAMSAAMTSCGERGWLTDRSGYRYSETDPESGRPWPPMPNRFRELARHAAQAAGYHGFDPDACLINRYAPGARMGLHQDRDEQDFSAPIVSVSLGLPVSFLFGGPKRRDRYTRHPLSHGDVLVWGGETRLYFHGVAPLKPGVHPATGEHRINLTFRRAV